MATNERTHPAPTPPTAVLPINPFLGYKILKELLLWIDLYCLLCASVCLPATWVFIDQTLGDLVKGAEAVNW